MIHMLDYFLINNHHNNEIVFHVRVYFMEFHNDKNDLTSKVDLREYHNTFSNGTFYKLYQDRIRIHVDLLLTQRKYGLGAYIHTKPGKRGSARFGSA